MTYVSSYATVRLESKTQTLRSCWASAFQKCLCKVFQELSRVRSSFWTWTTKGNAPVPRIVTIGRRQILTGEPTPNWYMFWTSISSSHPGSFAMNDWGLCISANERFLLNTNFRKAKGCSDKVNWRAEFNKFHPSPLYMIPLILTLLLHIALQKSVNVEAAINGNSYKAKSLRHRLSCQLENNVCT